MPARPGAQFELTPAPPPVTPTESPVHAESTRVAGLEKQQPHLLEQTNQVMTDVSQEFRFANRLDDRGNQLKVLKQQIAAAPTKAESSKIATGV